jgi:hypothetical protein
MTEVTEAQVCDAIRDTLATATGINVAQSYDELTEGIHDENLLQVYPESGETSFNSSTDRRTFGSSSVTPKRQDVSVYHVDYYCTQRSNIGDDMAKLVPGITAIKAKLNAQNGKPYFGLTGIKAFQWRWERTVWDYGGVAFIGARFTITITIF